MKTIGERIRKEKNLRFKIAFTETNILWCLGDEPRDEKKIDWLRSEVEKAKAELATLPPVFG